MSVFADTIWSHFLTNITLGTGMCTNYAVKGGVASMEHLSLTTSTFLVFAFLTISERILSSPSKHVSTFYLYCFPEPMIYKIITPLPNIYTQLPSI